MKHPPRTKTYHQSKNTQRSRNYFDTLCLADPSCRPLPGEDDLCDICIDDHDIDDCERSQRVVDEDFQAFRILSKTVEPLQIFRNTSEKEPCIQNTERHDPEFGVPFAGHIHSEELIESSERESKAEIENMRIKQGSKDTEQKCLIVMPESVLLTGAEERPNRHKQVQGNQKYEQTLHVECRARGESCRNCESISNQECNSERLCSKGAPASPGSLFRHNRQTEQQWNSKDGSKENIEQHSRPFRTFMIHQNQGRDRTEESAGENKRKPKKRTKSTLKNQLERGKFHGILRINKAEGEESTAADCGFSKVHHFDDSRLTPKKCRK